MFYKIIFLYAIPTWNPTDQTIFQGFAPGLIPLLESFLLPLHLPGDIMEFAADDLDEILIARRAGEGGWTCSPVNVDALTQGEHPHLFSVIFSADKAVAQRVHEWITRLTIQPLHVSTIQIAGAISPDELTMMRLQQHCLRVIRTLNASVAPEDEVGTDVSDLIRKWRVLEKRPSTLRLHSHNVTLPNEMTLVSTGQEDALGTKNDGRLVCSPHEDYVAAITESAQAVIELQMRVQASPFYSISPPRPDIIIFAPALFSGIEEVLRKGAAQLKLRPTRQFLRALERQTGYIMGPIELDSPEAEMEEFMPLVQVRAAELKIQTYLIGLRAAATVAATIRLPAAINRTADVVANFARHLRAHERPATTRTKTSRVFKTVQRALLDSIPPEHLELISKATDGIKIVSNAPLEWLPINSLPLGIRSDVSRINATPGNTMIDQLRVMPPIPIPPNAFRNCLVVSMFEEGDPLAYDVEEAFQTLKHLDVTIAATHTRPHTVEQFVRDVSTYEGPILLVDSHGQHTAESNIGGLIIGGNPVDVWSLKGIIKVPPIVVVSACDTHPFDRSHASVANGFLHCGAIAVLATVLPIRSTDAATFLRRLMLRAVQFGDAMNGLGVAVPWTSIVGGALRMQLVGDVISGLVERDLLPRDLAPTLQLQTNCDINPPRYDFKPLPDWFERFSERCCQAGNIDEETWQSMFETILAASDVIRYVNVGNPESIVVRDQRVEEKLARHAINSQS